MQAIGNSNESSILNSIFKEAKTLSPAEKLAVQQFLSREIPNDGFGKFVRDLLFDSSTKLDYEIVARKMMKHFPELKKDISRSIGE